MALFDFLFKRKKDEPQPATEDRPSENPPAQRVRQLRMPERCFRRSRAVVAKVKMKPADGGLQPCR